ncbi:hypothetical protein CP8484711_2209B, partial [Chlamydia psittaci 84-8471/1]
AWQPTFPNLGLNTKKQKVSSMSICTHYR